MPRKGENIYKRKDGRWEGRYRKTRNKEGKIIYGYVYGKKYSIVQKELAKKKWKFADTSEQLFLGTLSEWLDRWLYLYLASEVKKSTLISYETKIKNHIRPFFRKKTLLSLTKENINEFVFFLKNQNLSDNTINSILNILKSSLNYATDKGYLTENPSRSIISIKRKVSKIRALSLDDQKKLEFYAFQEKNCSAVIIALATGLRIGEICGLKWIDIDFEKDIIHIQRSLQRISEKHITGKTKVIIDTPKTASSIRNIPLAKYLKAYLLEKKNRTISEFVVSVNQKYTEPRTVTYRFKKMLIEAELDDFNFHVLRHTFATRCVENGVDIASLSKILGHTSIKLTLDTYTDSLWENRQEAMKVIDRNQFSRNF